MESNQKNEHERIIAVRGPEVEGASELPAFKQETPSYNKMASVSLSFQSENSFDGDISQGDLGKSKKSEARPVFRQNVSLMLTSHQIEEIFDRVCERRLFQIIDSENGQRTAVSKRIPSLKDLFMQCLHFTSSSKTLVALRLTLQTDSQKMRRTVIVKGLYGDSLQIRLFFADFQKELELADSKKPSATTKATTSENGLNNSINITNRKFQEMVEEPESDEDEGMISQQNLESHSFYEFNKILSSNNYGLGKKLQEFITDFNSHYKNVEESAATLPQPMESIVSLINQTVDTLFCEFNYGKLETLKMMPYCRSSVEKFIFDKVDTLLYGMYKTKYGDKNQKLLKKIEAIQNHYKSASKILKFLDVDKNFWLIDKENLDENDEPKEGNAALIRPYQKAIWEIKKLSKTCTPREKLNCFLMLHSQMKSSVVDFHKGKQELVSMDDELPLIIFILVHTTPEFLYSDIHFVEDFIKLETSLESEKRLMVNIKVSAQYIVDEWNLE